MKFNTSDVANYYDQTEVHYRMHWKLKEAMGLHYGIWDENTHTMADAILNTNYRLMQLGNVKATDLVLDAGCGIGGSSIYLTKKTGCQTRGITVSKKQVATASALAKENNLAEFTDFSVQDYNHTSFPDETFDIVWCLESMETAQDKSVFFKEIYRVLKPGGKILIADIFKIHDYDILQNKTMQTMIYGWAMSDILTITQLETIANEQSLSVSKIENVTLAVGKSVNKIYMAGLIGMMGTKIYNFFHKASFFSRIHYKTAIAQYHAYRNKDWGYYLVVLEKRDQ